MRTFELADRTRARLLAECYVRRSKLVAYWFPPGRHVVRFRCRPPESFIPSDARKLFFFIAGLKPE